VIFQKKPGSGALAAAPREFTRQVDDQHLKLWVTIERLGADHPGAVDGRDEGSANRLVEAVLHEISCPTDSIGGWMCTTMPFAAANSHSHSALGLSRKTRSEALP
jgi:hypothetical protein